jgi:hypothetical protein
MAETIKKYYLALSEKAEHTPWGTQVRASAIEIPARVLKADTRPERERRPKPERDDDEREDSRDWRPQLARLSLLCTNSRSETRRKRPGSRSA